MKPTLLVLAAGMGSRYGGIKQIDTVGKNGECLLDYAAYDAKKCGFENKYLLSFSRSSLAKMQPTLQKKISVNVFLTELQKISMQNMFFSRQKRF